MMKILLLITLHIAFAYNNAFECGVIKSGSPLIAHAFKSYHGQWPWMASLMLERRNGEFEGVCSATLINEISLITGDIDQFLNIF